MLLLNINNLLYNLTTSRVFIIEKTNENNELLLANNAVCFNLTKKESLLIKPSLKKLKGFDILYEYTYLIYKDEKHQHVIKSYPTLLNLRLNFSFFLANFISLLKENNNKNYNKILILKRSKCGFLTNCFGLKGYISFFSLFNGFSERWFHKKIFKIKKHKLLFKTMLSWMQYHLFIEIYELFAALTTVKKKRKKKKKFLNQLFIKPTIVYSLPKQSN